MLRQTFTALLLAPALALASGSGDRWGDKHVKDHVIGEAAVSMVLTVATDDRRWGLAGAAVAGVAREEWKRRHGYSSYSPSRIIADTAGALIGAQAGHCIVAGRSLACAWEF